jgi:uncharacterized coiled-coil DUF342 family protein
MNNEELSILREIEETVRSELQELYSRMDKLYEKLSGIDDSKKDHIEDLLAMLEEMAFFR